MSIVDGLNNQYGVQTLGTGIATAQPVAQHASDILVHSSGNLYVVTSEDYVAATLQRRLYLYRSTDGGDSWNQIASLTSGRFDMHPQIFQLDSSTDIGIVFVGFTAAMASSGVIRRMAVDPSGTETLPPDEITGSPTTPNPPFIVPSSSGYKLFFQANRFVTALTCYANSSYGLNSWASESNQNVLPTNQEGQLNRIRVLSNGDYVAVFTARTGLDGSLVTGTTNSLPDNLRTDVLICTSSNEGVTWNTAQNLTNYSGTAGVSKNGINSAMFADVIEQSTGDLSILFAETKSFITIDSDTTPAINPTGALFGYRKVLYHHVHDLLIYGHDGSSGGCYVHDLGSNVVTRIHTGSTPAIWENSVRDMALSDDGKYFVVTTGNTAGGAVGSIEIFDTTNADPTTWSVTSLRTSTTPATVVNRCGQVQFLTGGYDFVFTYGENTGSAVVGGRIDASNPVAITAFNAPSSATLSQGFGINEGGNKAYGLSGTTLYAINLTTGASLYSSTITGASQISSPIAVNYQTSTGEIILVSTSTLKRITDTGASFTVTSTLDTTTTPAFVGTMSHADTLNPNNILINGNTDVAYGMYVVGENLWYPGILQNMDANLGWNFKSGSTFVDEVTLSGKRWLVAPNTNSIIRSTQNTGRLRLGTFSYNGVTHQINTASANFYDAVSELRVGTDWDRIQRPRIHIDSEDRLHVTGVRINLNRATQPKKVITGRVEPDVHLMTMQGAILNTVERLFQMKARIRALNNQELDIKAQIVFAQCIKLLARIIPRVTYTHQMRACIDGAKSNDLTVTFDVQNTRRSNFVGRFFVPGYTGLAQIQMRAFLVKPRSLKFTGHFLVAETNTPKIASYAVTNMPMRVQTLRIGAGIIRS